jgi:ATP-dependent Clp protease ATP-binding subunit ClpB
MTEQEQTIHLEKYTDEAKALVTVAQELADEKNHNTVEPVHLLACSLDLPEIASIFYKLGADPKSLMSAIDLAFERLPKSNDGVSYLSTQMQDLLARAEKEGGKSVTVNNLLNAISQEFKGPAGNIIHQFGIEPGSLRAHVASLRQITPVKQVLSTNSFTRDMIACANNGDFGPIIGRDAEVRRLLQVLSRQSKNNPLMVGEPGCGKGAIVEEIAKRFAKQEVAPNLAKMAFIELEIVALTSGVKSRNEIEERVKHMLDGFKKESKSAIILIDGVENLFSQNQSMNISDLFKTLLLHEEIRVFGITTPEGLRKINDKDQSFVRRFTVMNIDTLTSDQSIEVLRGVSGRFEKYHKVNIGDPAIVAAVKLAKRYVQDKALPDSAMDLLDEASARKRLEMTGMPVDVDKKMRRLASCKAQQLTLQNVNDPMSMKTLKRLYKEISELEPDVMASRNKLVERRNIVDSDIDANNIVNEQDVAQVVGEWTGIPVTKMLEDETEKLIKMEERIGATVVGQDEAVKAVSKSIRRGRVGLRDPGKPIGSFLFLGSSGTGKTLLAKALAEFMFDDPQAMVRLDMSEFMEKHMAARLVGSPPGYADSDQGGFLTEAVRKRPYSVLLFDEVEKAHPDVFNLLLQILDDGRLTDGRGRTADFSNTIIIMTTNIGSKKILDAPEEIFETPEGREQMNEVLRGETKNFFRPEFLNRIDDIVIFRPLTKKNLRGIVDIELHRVEKLVADKEYKIHLNDEAKDELVDISYEPAMGARPLKRSILKNIQDPLAEAILANGYKDGSTIRVALDGDRKFVFLKK